MAALCLSSCKEDDNVKKDQNDKEVLDQKFEKIEEIADGVKCDDPKDWAFTAYGSKPCGGPVGYIAYSLSIDVDNFLKLVEEYTKAMEDYNKKVGVFSDCAVVPAPVGVDCEDGKAMLLYSPQ